MYYDGSPRVYYVDDSSTYSGTSNDAYSYNFGSITGSNSSTDGTSTLTIKNIFNGVLIAKGAFNITIRNITYPFSLNQVSGIVVRILDDVDGS